MPPESRRPAELLISDVGRLRRLVEELMEISRLDAGVESVQAETVDLASVTAAILRARGWDGRARLDAEEAMIKTDPRRFERVVTNLVGNALEHGGDGVDVRVRRDGDGAVVEVADQGPGIAPDTCHTCSSASTRQTPRARARGRASASRSRRRTRGSSAARSRSGASPARARASRSVSSACRCRTVTSP